MKKTRNILIIGNIIAVIGVVAFIIASQIAIGLDIKCTMVEKLHMYCPGCGGTRALYSLLRFDVFSALKYNIALPFALFTYIFYNVKAIISIVKKEENFFNKEKFVLIYAFIAILLVNFVVRNILLWGFGIDFIGDILPPSA